MNRIFVVVTTVILAAIASTPASAQPRPTPTPARTATAQPAPARPSATTPQPAPATAANVPSTKIGLVDTSLFSDEREGIRRFLSAVKAVEVEFKPRQQDLQALQSRIRVLSDEISKLSGNPVVDPKSIQAKQDEGERLGRDLKYRKEQFDADVERRYKEQVGPITAEISKALNIYAQQNGLTMVLDISKLLPALLTVNPATDVTRAFIADFNSKNP
jgi:Skp family chaperone for outer membrane proteins